MTLLPAIMIAVTVTSSVRISCRLKVPQALRSDWTVSSIRCRNNPPAVFVPRKLYLTLREAELQLSTLDSLKAENMELRASAKHWIAASADAQRAAEKLNIALFEQKESTEEWRAIAISNASTGFWDHPVPWLVLGVALGGAVAGVSVYLSKR